MKLDRVEGAFDPRASAERQRGAPLLRARKLWREDPLEYLKERWEQRNTMCRRLAP